MTQQPDDFSICTDDFKGAAAYQDDDSGVPLCDIDALAVTVEEAEQLVEWLQKFIAWGRSV